MNTPCHLTIFRQLVFLTACLTLCLSATADVPQLLNHQGRIAVNAVSFEGDGQFKFALVNIDGTQSYWSNDATSDAGSEPTDAVTLAVSKGLYAVLLGDTTLPNMVALTANVFDNADVRLRVWFNDGTNGFQLMIPDQRLAAAAYALVADKAVTASNFDSVLAGDVTGPQGGTEIAAETVTGKMLTGFVSQAGTLAETDTLLAAFGKLDGNHKLMAPLANPTFTGTVRGITSAMVGLGNANNTSDADKPVSDAQQTALDLKAPRVSPTFTGTVTGITASMVGLGDVTNTSDENKPVSIAQHMALDLKADLVSPTFTGTVSGITSAMVGLGDVSNTSDANKPVSSAQQTALDLKANLASPTFTGTVSGITAAMVGLGNSNNTSDANKPISSAQQTALDLKANLASPTFTGTVSGITAAMVGLGDISNTSDANKPVSSAQQFVLDMKANLESPTFTGNVGGITSEMVGLGNVTNTSDSDKPVSSAQQAALDIKANVESPNFSGTVTLPAGNSSAAPLKLTSGTNLTTAVLGAVEFDGTNLYLTTNAASPTRKIVSLSDSVSNSQISLTSVVTAPPKPVLAWGNNHDGQTTLPLLANVAAVAAGSAHSLALLKAGTVVAWGLNTSGQTTVPGTATGVTEIAAGTSHNLARKSDGTIVAWGDNSYGQSTIPSGITTAIKVAAGDKHSLALLSDGSVRAWGDNTFGQTTIPGVLSAMTVTAIAAGYDHCLALTSYGTVVAWGRNDAGQTDGSRELSGVIAVAAGAYHSLALKSDGSVVALGWDSGLQVSSLPANLTGVTAIAGGYTFSMALKADGTLVVWGDNSYGQRTYPIDATQVTAIAAGAFHALALRADSIPAQVARLDQDNVFAGKVGIKRNPAVNALEVEGTASKTTASGWLANSDRRIKTDIESITGALEKIDQVRLVDFRYTAEYRAAHASIEDIRYPNVIAQEFAEVFPNNVTSSGELMPDGSPILQVDTYPLTIYTAAAVQELHRENQVLKQQVSEQERRLRKLEALLAK
ncbi:MAG: tail fiber domain-containing protein [Verrucomicrobiota bacterium]